MNIANKTILVTGANRGIPTASRRRRTSTTATCPALLYSITATLKPFLAKKGHSREDVEKMHQAWVKSVLLQVILWSYPYVKDGDF